MRILIAETTPPCPNPLMVVALTLLVTLSGCNSLDALTPPENVGDGSYQSSPVNQADLDTMAAQQPVVRAMPSGEADRTTSGMPVAEEPVQRSARLGEPMSAPATGETAYASGDSDYRNPAGTFEAQASALASNPPPQVADQIDPRERAVGFPASENRVRDTQAAARARQADEAPPEEASSPEAEDAPREQAAIAPAVKAGPVGTIRFLPIIGAPVEAIRPLSEQLGADARAHGLTIKTAADPGSQHILKGYFSAFKDGRKTTIVYVWDVLDQAGNRLHRIQGQDSVDTKSADLWSGVPPQTMRDIASKSVRQYLEWRDETAG